MASLFLKAKNLILFACAMCLSGCSGLLFYPMKQQAATPDHWQLGYEDVYLEAAGEPTLHGWWLPAAAEASAGPKGTVYFLHGNAENISTHIANVSWLPAQGFNVFLLDYRGYGLSAGDAELAGAIADVRRGYTWVRARAPEQPLIVLGQSLGASLAGYAMTAVEPRPDMLVLDAAVASYRRIASEVARRSWLTWLFSWPVAWSMPGNFDLQDVIADLGGTPILFIRSDDDVVVPPGHTNTLYERARQPKRLLKTHGPHTANFAYPENREAFLQFFVKNYQIY